MTPSVLAEQWGQVLAAFDLTLHTVANHRVDVRADEAVCTSVVTGFHRAPAGSDGMNHCVTYGTLTHELLRGSEGWRIRALAYRQLHVLGNSALLEH